MTGGSSHYSERDPRPRSENKGFLLRSLTKTTQSWLTRPTTRTRPETQSTHPKDGPRSLVRPVGTIRRSGATRRLGPRTERQDSGGRHPQVRTGTGIGLRLRSWRWTLVTRDEQRSRGKDTRQVIDLWLMTWKDYDWWSIPQTDRGYYTKGLFIETNHPTGGG